MLRRYRSLKKIVYAACILFATIILYAGTSSHDYHQDISREWVLPVVGRSSYHVDVSLHEPLHRLPLGPFEDHPVPIMVEELKMQVPTFEASILDDPGPPSNVPPSIHNDTGKSPAVSAAEKLSQPLGVVAEMSNSAAGSSAKSNDHAPEIVPAKSNDDGLGIAPVADVHAPIIPPTPQNPPIADIHPPANILPDSDIHPVADLHPVSAIPNSPAEPQNNTNPVGPIAHPVEAVPAVPVGNPLIQAVNPPAAAGNTSILIPPKPQLPLANPLAPHNPPPPPAHTPPTKPLPDFNKITAEMANRLNHTRSQCDRFKVPYTIDSEVYQLPQYNISYCKIPKAGCTYWEQVISFLNKPTYELSYLGIKMPFQISKFDIRYTSHFNLPRRDFKKETDVAEIMKSTRVIFVRHPLERLWSCYLEKFYLIDFWTTTGVAMKTTGADIKCPKSITFREFIDFTLPLFNENWAPMTELCNPCQFQPDIIGRVETLRDDSFYTLKKINQDWIFTEHDKFSREENQMLDMAIYNYQIHGIHWYSFYHKCLSQKELALKLWDVFKKVGYLSSHAVLPDNLPDYNQTTIIGELKSQFRKFPLGLTNGRAQQLKMMKRDYESLPKPIMAKILEKYAMDFQLFGYSTQLPLA